ncbi:MAG TPA: patatin-like phospholipase family protein [Mariniphaga sp.]|nr:patatin-like phospholipase family protein [Mariniphaga sp.]
MGKSLLSLITIFCFIAIQGYSQSVGLVLSGGGAKGIAHIEVIRALEENNIPIDYIAGTSIGAIVGGLYASGYSPDEMEELFRSDDFYFWSTGRIQKEYRYHFTRPEANPSWIELRLARKEDRITVLPPSSIIPEVQMDFAFMELLSATNTACSNKFDSLMVPFFCVATDIHSSEPVVLRDGDLSEAIRASMTFPIYFKAIEIDGKLLFDGGIVNNFPQDIMEDIYKPDIIIGHKVADGAGERDSDNILEQITTMVMHPTNYEIPPEKGILLETKFNNISLLDFQKYDFIAEEGRKTAEQYIDSIKNRVSRRVSIEEVKRKRNEFNRKKPELYFQNIQVEGVTDPMQRRFIIQSMKHNYNIISLKELKTEYYKLIANEHLKSIRPQAYYNPETGFYDLHLKVEPEKKMRVNMGGNISTKPINQGFVSLDYRTYHNRAYTLSSNIYFGRFYSSFQLGGRIDFPTALPFYLAGYSTFNRWDFFSSSSELFFEDVRPPYIIQGEYNLRSEAGVPLGLHSKLFAGLSFSNSNDEYYQTDVFLKEDKPDQTTFNAFSGQAGYERNTLNYKQYATEGEYTSVTAQYVTGREMNKPGTTSNTQRRIAQHNDFFRIQAKSLKYFNFGKQFTLGAQVEGVFSNKDPFQNYRSTMLSAPGYYPTPHSRSLFLVNFHSNNYLAGGLKTIFHLNPALHLRLEAHTFLPVKEELPTPELTVIKHENFFSNYYLQGMAALVYHTGVGPASISLNYYDKSNTKLYFTLNFGYILFNKRGY